MSILIKGIDMPESCMNCKFTDSEYCTCVLMEFWNDAYYVGYYENERAPWCPLVPVPPHGRLIDADTPITVYDEGEWGFPVNVKTTVFKFILGHLIGEIPPTIIEAEVDDG